MAEKRLVDFWASTIAARSPALLHQLRSVAQSILAARRALAASMPVEFVHCPSLDLLFTLFVADHHTMPVATLIQASPAAAPVARRWIDVFVQRDLVTRRGDDVVLTEAGFKMMTDACQAVIGSQMGVHVLRLN